MLLHTRNSLITKQVCISIFAIFLGSQITEGVLLVPYWQALSATEFYSYYEKFGPAIGSYYTILTIAAELIPIAITVSYIKAKHDGAHYALVSSIFAVLFIICFYVYFKNANELFYTRAFEEAELHNELITWSIWHWSRVGLEVISLAFLIKAFSR